MKKIKNYKKTKNNKHSRKSKRQRKNNHLKSVRKTRSRKEEGIPLVNEAFNRILPTLVNSGWDFNNGPKIELETDDIVSLVTLPRLDFENEIYDVSLSSTGDGILIGGFVVGSKYKNQGYERVFLDNLIRFIFLHGIEEIYFIPLAPEKYDNLEDLDQDEKDLLTIIFNCGFDKIKDAPIWKFGSFKDIDVNDLDMDVLINNSNPKIQSGELGTVEIVFDFKGNPQMNFSYKTQFLNNEHIVEEIQQSIDSLDDEKEGEGLLRNILTQTINYYQKGSIPNEQIGEVCQIYTFLLSVAAQFLNGDQDLLVRLSSEFVRLVHLKLNGFVRGLNEYRLLFNDKKELVDIDYTSGL